MSNSVQTLVIVCTGPNYPVWRPQMKAYLQAQGLWYTITDVRPGDSDDEKADRKEYDKDNTKARGCIMLRLASNIQQLVEDVDEATKVWDKLEEMFGKPSLGSLFTEFKGLMDLQIPGNAHPVQAIDTLLAYCSRLSQIVIQEGSDSASPPIPQITAEIPKWLQAMLCIVKLPSGAYESVIQTYAQEDLEDLDPQLIRRSAILAWEQKHGSQKPFARKDKEQKDAQKLSAIKRKQSDPHWSNQSGQQQQQQRHNGSSGSAQGQNQGEGGQKKKFKKRGNRAGKNKDGHFHQLEPIGHIAHSADIEPAQGESQYPKFKCALKLAKDLDVTPSFEQIRTLEKVVKNVEVADLDADAERASKRTKLADRISEPPAPLSERISTPPPSSDTDSEAFFDAKDNDGDADSLFGDVPMGEDADIIDFEMAEQFSRM